jgi:rSAM/selenodomain-associated transferase 2
VVIPTWNAARHLPLCLAALTDADEVIVADGGSSDDSLQIAEDHGARVTSAARGRGQQLAAGASAASGDALLFLHADTVLASGWRAAADKHLRANPRRPACFAFALDDPAWQARVLERGVAWRARRLGLPYGDQGLLLSRALYQSSGGYRPLALMEDVDILCRLPTPVVLTPCATTSAERWRRDGWWTRSTRNLLILALWRAGVSEARLASLYGRSRPASPSSQRNARPAG